jgi:uncharacterized membrane protein YcgQ (UPF0703/DUF1980 family)
MRKNKSVEKSFFTALFMLVATVLLFTASCAKTNGDSETSDIVEIREKMFIAQVNYIYMNADDYFGKTIKLEGVFKQTAYVEGEDPHCFVTRYGPGCCGNDGLVGFEVAWNKEKARQYPAVESWVEAEGVLRFYEVEGYMLSYIDLSSLNVLEKRGAETVLQ